MLTRKAADVDSRVKFLPNRLVCLRAISITELGAGIDPVAVMSKRVLVVLGSLLDTSWHAVSRCLTDHYRLASAIAPKCILVHSLSVIVAKNRASTVELVVGAHALSTGETSLGSIPLAAVHTVEDEMSDVVPNHYDPDRCAPWIAVYYIAVMATGRIVCLDKTRTFTGTAWSLCSVVFCFNAAFTTQK